MTALSSPFNLCRLSVVALALALPGPASTAAETPIGPEVASVLKKMSEKLSSAKQFTYSAERTIAASRMQGHDKPQSAEVTGALKRPDKLKVFVTGPTEDRQFYFDGKKMTVFDKKMTVYGEIECEGPIDQAIEKIAAKHGFFPPLSDFLVSDPYEALTADVTSANLLSNEEIEGEKCFRMGFTQEGLDWELWVAQSDHLPRKLLINAAGASDNPALEAVISDWNLKAKLADSEFEFIPPEGAENVQHRTVEEAAGGSE